MSWLARFAWTPLLLTLVGLTANTADAQIPAGTVNIRGQVTVSNVAYVPAGSLAAGQTGPLLQAVVAGITPVLTPGVTSPLFLTVLGALRVDGSGTTQPISGTVALGVGGPCTSTQPINQSASAQVITGTAAQKLYICSIDLVADVAMKVSIVEGTGAVCATGIAALWGGTVANATNGMSFAANGGIAKTAGAPFMKTLTAGDNLCILQSTAGLLAGSISFVSAP